MWRERKEGRRRRRKSPSRSKELKREEEAAEMWPGRRQRTGCLSNADLFSVHFFVIFRAATFGAVRRTRHSCAAVCVGGGGGGGGGWQRPEV